MYCKKCGSLDHFDAQCDAVPQSELPAGEPVSELPEGAPRKAMTGAERQKRWRARHPEKYRSYMRAWMRKKREVS